MRPLISARLHTEIGARRAEDRRALPEASQALASGIAQTRPARHGPRRVERIIGKELPRIRLQMRSGFCQHGRAKLAYFLFHHAADAGQFRCGARVIARHFPERDI